MAARAPGVASLGADSDDEEDEVMRGEVITMGKYGMQRSYLIGPKQVTCLKIADQLKRDGMTGGDAFVEEEACMRAMGGQIAAAKELSRGLATKADRDRATRTKPHMAFGPVYVKTNEWNAAVQVLTTAGGNPGDTWEEVAEILNFNKGLVESMTRGKQGQRLTLREAVDWVNRYQAAQHKLARVGHTLETKDQVEMAWAVCKKNRVESKKRKAALAAEKKKAQDDADAGLPGQSSDDGFWSSAVNMISPWKRQKK